MMKVSSVPLMYQAESKLCWYASARMLYKWSQATTRGLALNPADTDEGYIWRHSINGSVGSSDNHHFAKKHNLVQHTSISIDESSLLDFFKDHGPIWAGISKNWNGNSGYGHVVVICGVATTGVFIHDPEPVKKGSSFWLTWDQINSAIDSVDGTPNPQFLSAV